MQSRFLRMLGAALASLSLISAEATAQDEPLNKRCLTRDPLPDELERLKAVVSTAENPQTGLEDVFWAVLNSREFLFNH